MADAAAGGSVAVPIRTLFISTAFSILISLAVYAVASMLFVFPVIARQDSEIGALRARVLQLQEQVADIPEAPEAAPAAAAAPAAPAPAVAAAAPAAPAAK